MKSDLELVNEVKAGERSAFSELVKRHQKALLRLCLRFTHDLELAEEVVQESFIKAYEKIEMFEGRSSFKSWVYKIAINTAKNALRPFRGDTVSLDVVHLGVRARAEADLVRRDIQKILQAQVDRLPLKQRTAVVLRLYEDLSFHEISQIMECPYDTAKANFRHGLLKIKDAFDENSVLKAWYSSEFGETEIFHSAGQEVES